MREGPQLRVDAYGVRGCARSCRGASTPSRHSLAHYCEGHMGAERKKKKILGGPRIS